MKSITLTIIPILEVADIIDNPYITCNINVDSPPSSLIINKPTILCEIRYNTQLSKMITEFNEHNKNHMIRLFNIIGQEFPFDSPVHLRGNMVFYAEFMDHCESTDIVRDESSSRDEDSKTCIEGGDTKRSARAKDLLRRYKDKNKDKISKRKGK